MPVVNFELQLSGWLWSALNFGVDCRMGCVQWYFCLGTRPKLGPSHQRMVQPPT